MKFFYSFLLSAFAALSIAAQTPCEAGFAGVYPCENVDLLAYMGPADIGNGNYNDIWGWTDPLDGREYVMIGRFTATSFIDITDPLNPVYLGYLPTHTVGSTWRDIKTFGNYAYIVSEAGDHGMQVFDLTRLRNVVSAPEEFTEDAHYPGFGKAHNVVINPDFPRAYGVGTNTFSGGLHIVDISDPLNPVIAGDYSLDGYTHDAQVVTYHGPDTDYSGMQISFNSNTDAITIVNVNDPSDTETISTQGYANTGYTHQCWLTEDHRFLLSNDELDEVQQSVNTTTFIWDVQDLDNPVLIGTHVSAITAIDHNLYTRGNLCYQSNYRGGLRMLDMTDIENANLNEVAYFDVDPTGNAATFAGTWSNYPYFESGVVAVSHMQDGLFLLRPNFIRATPEDQSLCAAETAIITIDVLEGFSGPVNLSVEGLPEGATALFTQNDVESPASLELQISGFPNLNADYTLSITGVGEFYEYSRTVTVSTIEHGYLYADTDEDGFGDATVTAPDCVEVLGYVDNNLDCDDNNNMVYPGAAGTMEGLDNDCNGVVEDDEVAPCLGDLNDDNIVNVGDLLVLLSDIGCNGECIGDLNGDLNVTTGDLTLFLSVFGTNCN